jgi:hypothetical protein
MHALVALFLLAQPFWETKTPDKWSNNEIEEMRTSSPWAQKAGPTPSVVVYFATAAPIEDAEAELRVRGGKNPLREPDAEYLAYLSKNREDQFALAIPYQNPEKALNAEALKRMEEESVMVIGRKKVRMSGYFPPINPDPVLRLMFPREVQAADKKIVFKLYLPGIEFPDREVDFNVKDLMYHGKLEM